jgi:hypothetical protein
MNSATQKPHYLARDRQSQPCTTELAAYGAIRLVEGFEYTRLLLLGDADTGICYRQGDLTFAHCAYCQRHAAFISEFDRIGDQVFEYLLQPLRVGFDNGRNIRCNIQ